MTQRRVLDHLSALVAADTRNPPREIRADQAPFEYLRTTLSAAGFAVELRDLGGGSVSLHALRGRPRLLCNVHLDTVSDGGNWARNPHQLAVEADRAFGLGACDAKGGAACLIAAAEAVPGDLAILFTTDEEGSDERCVRDFLSRQDIDGGAGRRARAADLYGGVVVGEPTSCRAVLAHRGLGSAELAWSGRAGHGSEARAMTDSAVHAAVRWSARALDFARAQESEAVGGLSGIRLNLGLIAGGVASNVIADRCHLRFGVRSRPGEDPSGLIERLATLDPSGESPNCEPLSVGPPLPPPGGDTAAGQALAERLGLPLGAPVDFWSEAALFAAAGLPSLVFGPGSILQAHAPGEWVALSQLDEAYASYQALIARAGGGS